jgi:hypothetical protein
MKQNGGEIKVSVRNADGHFGSFHTWVIAAAIVLILGIFSITYSIQAKASNDIDAARLLVLTGNVSSLSLQELINLHNITVLDQNITQSELRVLLLESRIVILQGDILVIQNAIQVIDTNITTFYENITTLYGGIESQWLFIENMTTDFNNNVAFFVFVNQSAFDIIQFGLKYINNVTPVDSNINLLGQCGINASAGILSGTVVIDACALEAQLINLTNTLQSTAAALFASVNASNTTLDTINGQSPNAGQIFIVAGGLASIYPGIQSNVIVIATTGMIRINDIIGVNNIVGDGNVLLDYNTTTQTITAFVEPFIESINATLGIVNVAPPNSNGFYNISTNLTAYGASRNSLSSVCMYAVSTVGPDQLWSRGVANETSYVNLLTCSIPFNASDPGIVTKDCKYNLVSPELENHGACFSLYEQYAVYVVDFDVTINAGWISPNAWTNVNKLEFQYCLQGPTGCGITSSNWTRALQTTMAGYLGVAFPFGTVIPNNRLTMKYTALISSGSTGYSQIRARVYCRMSAADDFGNYVKTCFDSFFATQVEVLLSITRVA